MDATERAELFDAVALAITGLALSDWNPERLRSYREYLEGALGNTEGELKPAVRELFGRLSEMLRPVVADIDANLGPRSPE